MDELLDFIEADKRQKAAKSKSAVAPANGAKSKKKRAKKKALSGEPSPEADGESKWMMRARGYDRWNQAIRGRV